MATQMYAYPSVATRSAGFIRVMVCDPDAETRAQLRSLIDGDPVLMVVAEARAWAECEASLNEMVPDLLIARADLIPTSWPQRQEQDCFLPVVIALRDEFTFSGGLQQIDFLPVPADSQTIQHVLNQAVRDIYDRKAKQLLYLVDHYVAGSHTGSAYKSVVRAERDGEQIDLHTDQIISVVAARKHVVIHSAIGELTLREPIRMLMEKLDPQIFLRIHRSIIINRRHLNATLPITNRSTMVTLLDGTTYPIGPNYRDTIADTLNSDPLMPSPLSQKIA